MISAQQRQDLIALLALVPAAIGMIALYWVGALALLYLPACRDYAAANQGQYLRYEWPTWERGELNRRFRVNDGVCILQTADGSEIRYPLGGELEFPLGLISLGMRLEVIVWPVFGFLRGLVFPLLYRPNSAPLP